MWRGECLSRKGIWMFGKILVLGVTFVALFAGDKT